ncbi:MAG: dihydroneopterin aldolase [Chthoniobacteraceae bacterium]
MDDSIIVSRLEVRAHAGVPAAERGAAQRLAISLRLFPSAGLANLADDLNKTIDYAAVCAAVKEEAESRPRRLIETLAGEIATLLLTRYPLRAVEVEVRKFILPATEYVAVSIRREKPA